MKRRKFITLVGGAAAMWPLCRPRAATARTSLPGGLPRDRVAGANGPLLQAFEEGLRSLGYRVGENVVMEYRFANGETERLPALAADLVGLGVDVIVCRIQCERGCGHEGDHDDPDCHG